MKKIFFLIIILFFIFSSCKNEEKLFFSDINQIIYLPGLYKGEKTASYKKWEYFCQVQADSFSVKKRNALKRFQEKDPETFSKFWKDSGETLYASKAFEEYYFFIQNEKMLSFAKQKEAQKNIMGEN